MDKKVTSYRLPVQTLERLDQLVEKLNDYQREIAESMHFKLGRKMTRADLIDQLINQEWHKMIGSPGVFQD